MRTHFRFASPWLAVLSFFSGAGLVAAGESRLLELPEIIHAVPGLPCAVYFDNLALAEDSGGWSFEVEAGAGESDARRWRFTPSAGDAGQRFVLRVSARDEQGQPAGATTAEVRVASGKAGETREPRLLIVGDSLTHASRYPNRLAEIFSAGNATRLTLLGTHQPASAAPGTAHEGYGGWTWDAFLTRWDESEWMEPATPGAAPRRGRSPFLRAGAMGMPELDLPGYFRDHCGGQPPDAVFFLLGINDCFRADPENPDDTIDAALDRAETLLAAFRSAAPETALAVGLTTPPNSREEAFVANYEDRYTRWGWKRIQHRLVQRMQERLGDREGEGIYLVPVHLGLDPVEGYPDNNGVHPNEAGYDQIAEALAAWLHAWLAGELR